MTYSYFYNHNIFCLVIFKNVTFCVFDSIFYVILIHFLCLILLDITLSLDVWEIFTFVDIPLLSLLKKGC